MPENNYLKEKQKREVCHITIQELYHWEEQKFKGSYKRVLDEVSCTINGDDSFSSITEPPVSDLAHSADEPADKEKLLRKITKELRGRI